MYAAVKKIPNVKILEVNFLSSVYVCVFHWSTVKQRLFIISNIFVVKQVVVLFSLVEEYKGSLL